MKFSIFQESLKKWQGSALFLGICEEDLENQLHQFDSLFDSKILLSKIKDQKFKGEKNQTINFSFCDLPLDSLDLLGLGSKKSIDHTSLKKNIAEIFRKTFNKYEKISILLPWDDLQNNLIYSVAESIKLGTYQDNRFKTKQDDETFIKEVEFICPEVNDNFSFVEVKNICAGVEFARELVAAPPNKLTPLEMSKNATEIANENNLDIKILDKNECEKLGMGAFLAVAKGSDLDPKFIHITYRSNTPIKRKIALVGKGLTFDSGGYNLKVGASQIEMMKYDMGGSATVLGTAKAIGAIKPEGLEIHFIVASCENMINGSAVHPGDVVTASNGKTIEINNTDAEGRLTLADALKYASDLKPDSIIDLATLTGACVIALGNEVAGMWSNNQKLADELLNAASKTEEGLWQMPLQKSYKDGLKSHIADMKNTGPRAGGSITAALFLEEFLDANINWAHIDIAGTCWAEKSNGINPSGATGYGVRTLIEWIKSLN